MTRTCLSRPVAAEGAAMSDDAAALVGPVKPAPAVALLAVTLTVGLASLTAGAALLTDTLETGSLLAVMVTG